MATTRIIPMHKNKGKTIAECLKLRIDYVKNPDKTENGEHISSFMCNSKLADIEFALSQKIYEQKTGRKHKNTVIAYQIRQAFKPDEITPELANKIGYELAMKITKGKNAFIVATHTDKAHIHNHIIFNSVNLDCKKKFRDFLGSGKAIAKISDRLCLENNLSIIEHPKNNSKDYGNWLNNEKLSKKDQLKQAIIEVINEKPYNYKDFIKKMAERGYISKEGKHLAFRGDSRFIRLKSLGDGFSEEDILSMIASKKSFEKLNTPKTTKSNQLNLLVDVQKALDEKGVGYQRWAKSFNVKQLAQTISFLTEKKLLNIDDLKAYTENFSNEFNNIRRDIKEIESKMNKISELQKNIINFSKTKQTYDAYRKSGYSPKFKEQHITEITLHQATQNYFKENVRNENLDNSSHQRNCVHVRWSAKNFFKDYEKIPKMADLKQEWASLQTEKKKLYSKYNEQKQEHKDLLIAQQNVEKLLNDKENSKKFGINR